MGDDEKGDARIPLLSDKIQSGFPKLQGPKMDKALANEEVRKDPLIHLLSTLEDYFI